MERNNAKSIRRNSPKDAEGSGGQPAPMSGSHKVKNQNHTRQKHHSHHDQ